MPRVTIVMPAYNAARYLPTAIDSVIHQSYSDWELIVIDDGSTDETKSVATSYVPRTSGRLRYLYQSNRGPAAARNAGLQATTGEFIATLDADDVWLPMRLERGISVMDRSPQVGLVHSLVARINVEGNVVGSFNFPSKHQAGKIALNIYTRRANILSPTVLFRRQCIDTVGLFDEAFRGTEDRDLWFRIAERYEIAYIDEILALYRSSPGSVASDSGLAVQTKLSFARKHLERRACSRFSWLRALGQIYREQGDVCFSRGQLKQSLGYYTRSVCCNPFNPKNVYMLTRACAEPWLRGILPKGIPGATT
jgi:glycosyltransferase involved in cell wall biosynthesis